MRRLFARPDEVVLGIESGAAARARFRAALEQIVRPDARERVLAIAHGTVISLAVADANGLDGFTFWENLGMGDTLVLGMPQLTLLEHVRLDALP